MSNLLKQTTSNTDSRNYLLDIVSKKWTFRAFCFAQIVSFLLVVRELEQYHTAFLLFMFGCFFPLRLLYAIRVVLCASDNNAKDEL